jgi:hypothetical protein
LQVGKQFGRGGDQASVGFRAAGKVKALDHRYTLRSALIR